MATADLNGITIAYTDEGAGDPLLLIHGHPFDRSMWAPQIAALAAEGYRVVAPDLRGYGGTTVVPGRTLYSDYAADLIALLDHLGLDRVVAGGVSMGGGVAMELCRLHPERIRALVLSDCSPKAETEEGRKFRNDLADRLLGEGMAGYTDEVLDRMAAVYNPAAQDTVRAMMLAAPPEGAAASLRGRAERPGYEDVLRRLAVPALVVVGRDDSYTPVEEARLVRDLIPDATLHVVEAAAHLPGLERPDDFNAVLRRFLARTTLPPVNGYRHAVRARGDVVSVSGQIALDPEGRVVGEGDAQAQARQVFRNLHRALVSQGATFADVVKLTIFVTDLAALPAVRTARDEHIDAAHPPASSAVQVAGLVRPELLVEVDAVAVLE